MEALAGIGLTWPAQPRAAGTLSSVSLCPGLCLSVCPVLIHVWPPSPQIFLARYPSFLPLGRSHSLGAALGRPPCPFVPPASLPWHLLPLRDIFPSWHVPLGPSPFSWQAASVSNVHRSEAPLTRPCAVCPGGLWSGRVGSPPGVAVGRGNPHISPRCGQLGTNPRQHPELGKTKQAASSSL